MDCGKAGMNEEKLMLQDLVVRNNQRKPCSEEHKMAPHYKFHNEEMEKKTKEHPCYNGCNHENARIHLPVAPSCNIQCNYCLRKYDCVHESRPGVTTRIMTPEEALEHYKIKKKEIPNLTVIGIAGPGDALADFESTKNTIQSIREYDSRVTFCLSTNGLMLPEYAQELVRLGVSHVTVTVNAVDPVISAKIYKYVKYQDRKITGEEAGAILLQNQRKGLQLLNQLGVISKVNIVILKGINDDHITEVVQNMKELGCYVINIMPFISVIGSEFELLPKVSQQEVNEIRNKCSKIMYQMYHCKQCRADAVGTLYTMQDRRGRDFPNNA